MSAISSLFSSRNHITDGQAAENLAAVFLERQGLRIVGRNFRIRGGELDLICQDANTLVFVEVRLRRPSRFGDSADSITRRKQQRIILAARHYLARLGRELPCRFDCVLLSDLRPEAITWLRDAFSA